MLNVVTLQGNLTKDPQIKTSSSGKPYVQFQIAVNQYYNQKQTVDYISCSAFGSAADFIGKYFHKGSQIIVEGSLHQNNYQDANGVMHYNMQVTVRSVNFCGVKSDASDSQQSVDKPFVPNVKKDAVSYDFLYDADEFELFD